MKEKQLLIVDLDNTLLKTDLLYECFWSAFSKNWKIIFSCIFFLFKGKAMLKRFLFQSSSLKLELLPYDKEVIKYIKNFSKKNKCKVGIVTAANQDLANKISNHLGLFDFVYGSNQKINLKGKNKLNFIKKISDDYSFVYMGISSFCIKCKFTFRYY